MYNNWNKKASLRIIFEHLGYEKNALMNKINYVNFLSFKVYSEVFFLKVEVFKIRYLRDLNQSNEINFDHWKIMIIEKNPSSP